MYIESLTIEGIGGICHLTIPFRPGVNILCGTNGVGKTTILECISHFFIQQDATIKRNSRFETGKCTMQIIDNDTKKECAYTIESFMPLQSKHLNVLGQKGASILYFKTYRDIAYSELSAVPKDVQRQEYIVSGITHQGVMVNDFKGWFINRYLFYKDLSESQRYNYELAIDAFSIFDDSVSFGSVDPSSLDILLNTTQGPIYFEYLSAGYKSCIYIFFGIIKEIEFRFKEPQQKVCDFEGIILIDEVELHLHPQWQTALINGLKRLLPKTQIIMTTHSPNIIQSAEPHEVIALEFDSSNNVKIRKIEIGGFGFQGWSLEEILVDVMGLESTKSELYISVIQGFESALDTEDVDRAKKAYDVLSQMLHPNNTLRKLLRIQMSGMGGDTID